MKSLNVIWMYPNILNNYGDRGNIFQLEAMCRAENIEFNLRRVETYNEEIDFSWANLILFNSGELRTMPRIIEDLQPRLKDINTYLDEGKYIIATNNSATIFGEYTARLHNDNYEGLGSCKVDFREKEGVYGDDILVESDNMRLLGVQVQMINWILKEDQKEFAKVVYGYGNDYISKKEGARYKNLILTSICGPLLAKNPWFAQKIIDDILENEVPGNYDIEAYREKFPHQVKAFHLITDFINKKNKVSEEDMKFYLK